MKKRAIQIVGASVLLLLLIGMVVPYVNADQYGQRLKDSLERSLGRQVDIGRVRFSLFKGPGFSVERDDKGPGVVIHEDPAIGLEPIAYVETMEVRPSLLALLGGKFRIASIRLEDASINLVKSGPAEEAGRWNFTSFVDRSVMSSMPAVHIRNGRINFKFGDTKSIFYLTETDLDILPPARVGSGAGGGWNVSCTGQPARTDRTGHGLGLFSLKGHWFVAPERVDLDLTLDRTGLGEWTALLRGEVGAVHGTVTSRLHLGGPIHNIGIAGRLTIEDIHRWDLLPPSGQGWPLDVRGTLDLVGQRLELETNSAGKELLPLSVRVRATDYLSQPHWAVAVNWNRFPLEPLMELASHMGAQLPPGLKMSGTMDGAMVYPRGGRLEGELGFHDTAVIMPDLPPLRFEHAYLVLDQGHVRLSPAVVHTGDDQAGVEADYAIDRNTLDLAIHSDAMKVSSLRAQGALPALPWLEHVTSGQWSGDLHYRRETDKSAWTGRLQITGAELPVTGLADPVRFESARLQVDGERIAVDQIVASAGKVAFRGEYRHDPAQAQPDRVRLRSAALNAADLEAQLLPSLRRDRSLIARALGRTSIPEWMKDRALEGTVQIDDLVLDGVHLANVRAGLRWDIARVELDGLQAKLDRAAITGRLIVGLRGAQPTYRLAGKVKGLNWQSGKLDAEGTLETSGTGAELLANLKSEATFTGSALDFGAAPPWRTVSGSCNLAWSPRLHVTDLSLKTAEDETYTGKGSAQEDGKLIILLSNGAKEMKMTGTLTNLKVE
jgi:hypothetical protein